MRAGLFAVLLDASNVVGPAVKVSLKASERPGGGRSV